MGSIEIGTIGFPRPIGKRLSSGKLQIGSTGARTEAVSSVPEDHAALQPSRSQTPADSYHALFFDINVQVTHAISQATGGTQQQAGIHFNLHVFEAYAKTDAAKTDAAHPVVAKTDDTEATLEDRLNPLAKLQEYFSPDNTASRILDFALSRYGYGQYDEPDSSEHRAEYRDFIFPAIEQGFRKAVDAFQGKLPQEVMEQIHETLSKIKVGFENFIAAAEPAPSNGEAVAADVVNA